METNKKLITKKRLNIAALIIMYAIIASFLFFPFYFMFTRSFMNPAESAIRPVVLFPKTFTFKLWVEVFTKYNYLSFTKNTLIIVGFNIIAVPLSASFVAFGFARCNFWGKNALFAIMLGTVLLPGTVVQIPLFVLYSDLGMLNTYLPLMLPNLFGGGAMNVFLIRQFMRTIPKELDEAAVIDGAGYFTRYFKLTLPHCISVLIFITIGVFTVNWSDFYGPLIFMSVADERKYTLAYAIFRRFQASVVPMPGEEGLRAAAGVFMSIPPLILFFIFQRRMVDGIVMTGIKG